MDATTLLLFFAIFSHLHFIQVHYIDASHQAQVHPYSQPVSLTISSIVQIWSLTPAAIAGIVGMQQPTVSRLENGGCDTTIGTFLKIANALDLDVELKRKNLVKA